MRNITEEKFCFGIIFAFYFGRVCENDVKLLSEVPRMGVTTHNSFVPVLKLAF